MYDYIQTRYRLAAESTFGGERTYLVFVEAQLAPVAEHPGLGLPCYREVVDDPAVVNIGPFIRVRWVETLGDARRMILERALGLYRAEHSEGTTWRYQVPDASPQRLRTIVTHDMVADTDGFDRASLELDATAGDIARLAVQPLVYTSGWHPPESDPTVPESTWRWTRQTATLSLANPNADALFYLDFAARPDAFADGPQTVTVSIDDQVLQSFVADATGQGLHGIPLSLAALGTRDRVEIQIAVDRTFVPATLPAGGARPPRLGDSGLSRVCHTPLTRTLHDGPTVVRGRGTLMLALVGRWRAWVASPAGPCLEARPAGAGDTVRHSDQRIRPSDRSAGARQPPRGRGDQQARTHTPPTRHPRPADENRP